MLRIRPEQLRILTGVTKRAFAQKMANHLRTSRGDEVRLRFDGDDAALAASVDAAITEAAGLGIASRHALRRFLEHRFVEHRMNSPVTGVGQDPIMPDGPVEANRIDNPVETVPRQALSCHFVETRVRCGDLAHVEVEAHGVPDGTLVTVAVLRMTDEAVLAELTGTLRGQVTRLAWHPSRMPGMAAHDGFIVRVSAGHLTARSSDVLSFEQDPSLGPDLQTLERRDGPCAWTGRYRIAYDGQRVLVSVRIRIVDPRGEVPEASGERNARTGVPVSAPVVTFIKGEIERFLSDRFGFVREDCRLGAQCSCVKPVAIQVDFVEADEDHAVILHSGSSAQGTGRASAVAWTLTRQWRGQWAHAVGHLLGWLDDGRNPAGLMGAGELLQPDNLAEIEQWLTARTTHSWRPVRLTGWTGEVP